MLISYFFSKLIVTLESSQKIYSQDFNILIARKVISSKFPIGVETIYSSDMKNFLFIILTSIILSSCKSSSDLFIDRQIPSQQEARHPYESQGNFSVKELDTIYANKKKTKIALFLPFTGKHEDLGWSVYNSALMSLFDNDKNHNLELVLIDSKDNPVEASTAIREVINRDIKIIIGPIFSNFVLATHKNIMRNSIKAISLSNNRDLQGFIDDESAIFISGFLPSQEIDRIVSFALSQQKSNFAILSPNNSYGIEVSKLLQIAIKERDANIIQSELYERNSESLKKSVKRIVNAFKVSSDLAEGGGNKLEEDFRIKEDDKNYAQVIFVPESSKNLQLIAKLIKKYNTSERNIIIAGIGSWDDSSSLNNSNLDGVWFAAPIQNRYKKFEKEYYRKFSYNPPRIASIAYDSIAAIAQIIDKSEGKKISTEDFTQFKHEDEVGFDGIDGKFRYLENGLVQRNLAILTIENGEFEILDPPKERFLIYQDKNSISGI